MTMPTRRAFLASSGSALLLAGRGLANEVTSADADALAFSQFRALVRGDYLAGRVVVVGGWIMSEHEALRLAAGTGGDPTEP